MVELILKLLKRAMKSFKNNGVGVDHFFQKHVAFWDVVFKEMVWCVETTGEKAQSPTNGWRNW